MHSIKVSRALTGVMFLASLCLMAPLQAAESLAAPASPQIHVDIQVKLKQPKMLFNMSRLAFAGDLPIGLNYMRLLVTRLKETHTRGHIIGVFHSKAAYMTLNDAAYDKFRHVTTGNPYKGIIADLLGQGVQLEECAVSMKAHSWGNKDLLPGIKVNSGAVGRIVQLVQEGYVQIQP
ncbi:MAG: DsrE family protein [Acidiferrobacterales bacterium]